MQPTILSVRAHGAACAVAACLLAAPEAPANPEARRSLQALADAHAAWTVAAVEWRAPGPPDFPVEGQPAGRDLITRMTVAADGRFAMLYLYSPVAPSTAHEPPGEPAMEPKLFHFTFFDGVTGHDAHGADASRYRVAAASPGWTPGQHLFCPWPLVPRWAGALLNDPAAVFTRIPATTNAPASWRAASPALPITLEWTQAGALAAVSLRLDATSHHAVRFTDFDPAPPHAGRAHTELLTIHGQPRPAVVRRRAALEPNPPDAEVRLRFDPVALGAGRFDPVTGDVFNPDGTLNYNEKTLLARLDGRTSRFSLQRWGLYALFALAAALSAVVAYRRLRPAAP